MRKDFFQYLYDLMQHDSHIWALTADLGYMGFDKIRDNIPERFLNVGAAETALIDVAIGLALSGKIPVCYSITPFLLYRPFESLRTYVNHEKIPIILIGSGRDSDYKHDGFSHFAGDDKLLFGDWHNGEGIGILRNISARWPNNTEQMKTELAFAISEKRPTYINLLR